MTRIKNNIRRDSISNQIEYRETASSILLGIAHVRAQYAAKVKEANALIASTHVLDCDSVQAIPTNFSFLIGILDDSFCLQFWIIFADNYMKKQQERILKNEKCYSMLTNLKTRLSIFHSRQCDLYLH